MSRTTQILIPVMQHFIVLVGFQYEVPFFFHQRNPNFYVFDFETTDSLNIVSIVDTAQ